MRRTDKEAHKQVLATLSQFELDETAIEAEAIRKLSVDLELLDRMLTSLELWAVSLRPTVVQVLSDPFLAAQLSNAVLKSSLQRNE